MDADFCTIEVNGVPSGFPEDRMIDKLMIHFLRPRNGGGEVLRVLYSRRTPRLAFVVFEQSDVAARVLQRAHVLQVEEKSFPLTIRRGERAEVDLPVSTTLNLRKFRDQEAALSILGRYGFRVTRQRSGQLLLEGTFFRLSAARAKLAELLTAEAQSQGSFAEAQPGVRSAGAVSKWRPSSDAAALSYGQNGPVASRSPPPSSSFSPLSSQRLAASSCPPYRLDDTQSDRSADGFLSGWLPGKRRSAGLERASFDVDADTLLFARSFREEAIKDALQAHGVEMEVEGAEGAEVSTVVLSGRNAAIAKETLASFLTQVQTDLRTQEIVLSTMSQERQKQAVRRVEIYNGVYRVLVRRVNDTLRLVGSSSESYEMKQRILGFEVSQPSFSQGGLLAQERSRPHRRSSSLPRQPGRASARDYESGSAAARGYASSEQDDEPVVRGSRQGAGATEPHRKRSVSESRTKVKEGRATPGRGGNGVVPSAGAQRTTERDKPKWSLPPMNSHLMALKTIKDKISSPRKKKR